MSLEDAIMGGIVFKGKKEGPKKDENKVKTKAKKTTYIKAVRRYRSEFIVHRYSF